MKHRDALLALALLSGIGTALLYVLGNPWVHAWIKAHLAHQLDRRSELDQRAARELFDFARIGERLRYDPLAYLVFRPDLAEIVPWPEHRAGRFTLRTNDLGLREDAPLAVEKRGPRILVAGDSHTAGLVENAETFANRLEARLRTRSRWSELEVINAGVPFTGPYCYRGILRKYLELRPDVFIAVLFTGNDFWDELKVRYVLDGWTPPAGDDSYSETIARTAERWPGPASQGYNQAFRWKHFPWEPPRALAGAIESYLGMRDLCREHGIALVAVVLPTKMGVEPEDDAAVQADVLAALSLTPAELAVNDDLGHGFAAAMAEAGVHCLDLHEPFRAAAHPLYWRTDYHLGTSGHELVAAILEPEVAGLIHE